MKKIAIAMASLLLVAFLVSPAFAYRDSWGRGSVRGPCRDWDRGARFAELNLTQEQSDKIAALREAHLKDVKPLRDKMFSLRGDLKILWLQKNPDEEKIRATQKEIRALRDQLEDKRWDYRKASLNVLTPEQQAMIRARFGRSWGHCFERGPGGPAGGSGGPGRGMMGY
ncbi:MAG: Spy/CpxP family protein refolding chaperone [Deltaproteobacteria bacterium]|nr:Spy/CpxP family protein refolding chaperone [Deltaproteobacteria bacterium]